MLINNLLELQEFCKTLPLRKNSVVLLKGEVGAGKTTLVGTILQDLLEEKGPFTSPTFTLVQDYYSHNLACKIYHLDLYRLEKLEELEAIGFGQLLEEEAMFFIEWPELAEAFLAKIDQDRIIKLQLSLVEENKRIIERLEK